MNGQPEAAGSLETAVNAAFAAAIAWQREAREALWRAPSRRQVEATIRAQFERAEAAEARLAEVRQTVDSFLGHYGQTSLASFKVAQDLAEGIRQVLDREPLGTQGRSDGKEPGNG